MAGNGSSARWNGCSPACREDRAENSGQGSLASQEARISAEAARRRCARCVASFRTGRGGGPAGPASRRRDRRRHLARSSSSRFAQRPSARRSFPCAAGRLCHPLAASPEPARPASHPDRSDRRRTSQRRSSRSARRNTDCRCEADPYPGGQRALMHARHARHHLRCKLASRLRARLRPGPLHPVTALAVPRFTVKRPASEMALRSTNRR